MIGTFIRNMGHIGTRELAKKRNESVKFVTKFVMVMADAYVRVVIEHIVGNDGRKSGYSVREPMKRIDTYVERGFFVCYRRNIRVRSGKETLERELATGPMTVGFL